MSRLFQSVSVGERRSGGRKEGGVREESEAVREREGDREEGEGGAFYVMVMGKRRKGKREKWRKLGMRNDEGGDQEEGIGGE